MPFALPEVTNHVDRSDHSVGPSSLEDAKVAQPARKANLHVDMYVALFFGERFARRRVALAGRFAQSPGKMNNLFGFGNLKFQGIIF